MNPKLLMVKFQKHHHDAPDGYFFLQVKNSHIKLYIPIFTYKSHPIPIRISLKTLIFPSYSHYSILINLYKSDQCLIIVGQHQRQVWVASAYTSFSTTYDWANATPENFNPASAGVTRWKFQGRGWDVDGWEGHLIVIFS